MVEVGPARMSRISIRTSLKLYEIIDVNRVGRGTNKQCVMGRVE